MEIKKCKQCGKTNEHFHIRFLDGTKSYKFCKECCLKFGTCSKYKDKK